MDKFALGLANLLVGNSPNEPALEITLTGPELEFSSDALIAITGAEIAGIKHAQPVKIDAGDRVDLPAVTSGCRTYLAVAGGLNIQPVLNGAGTDLRAKLGGFKGRALQAGDVLSANAVKREPHGSWQLSRTLFPAYSAAPEVRVIPGSEVDEFGEVFWKTEFEVGPQSDRMGYRLKGPQLKRTSSRELISSAMIPGTVQVPPEGNPIVLMADAQTLGGYPRIAHVAQVDMPLLAQLRPGDHVSFRRIELEETQTLATQRVRDLNMLEVGLRGKLR
jgi:antagonist of KipI